MKKIITLIVLLMGIVGTVSATDYYLAGRQYSDGSSWYIIGQMTDADGDGTYSIIYSLRQSSGLNFAFTIENSISKNFANTVYCSSANSGNVDVKDTPTGSAKQLANGGGGIFYIGASTTHATDVKVEFTPKEDGTADYKFIRLISVIGAHNNWNRPGTCFLESSTSDEIYSGIVTLSGDYKYYATNKDNTYHDWGKNSSNYLATDGGNIGGYSGLYRLTANFSSYVFSAPIPLESVTTNASGFCTYVNTNPLTISDASAYYAKDRNNGSATAIAITNPPASTPMLIKGTASTTYYFEVAATGTALAETNAFKAGSGGALESSVDGKYNYILQGDKFKAANGQTVGTDKAYLQLSVQASNTARALIFPGEEEAGINVITTSEEKTDATYNLSGQRVANPSKGLYIVNGRKVIMK